MCKPQPISQRQKPALRHLHVVGVWVAPAMPWVGLLVTLILCPQTSIAADDSSAIYSISCRMQVDHDASLTPPLAAAFRQQIQMVFKAVLGPDQVVRFLNDTEAEKLPGLQQVDQESLARLWHSSDRLLMVRVFRQGNDFIAQAREYDPRFQILGPVREVSTMQRELAADAAGRVVLQAFSPLAEVRAVTGSNVQIQFLGGSRLTQYRKWLELDEDVGLQVMREPLTNGNGTDGGGSRPTRYRKTFLVLKKWEGDRAECAVVGSDRLFQDLDSTPVRYLARPVRGGNTSTRVQVVRKESRQAQPDCEVFVASKQYSTEPAMMRGLTDRTGWLQLPPATTGLQFVCVRYEDLILKAPVLPGASPDPVIFEVPTRGRRAEFVRPLRQLLQDIEDQYLVDLRLKDELKARADSKDTTDVRKLIERGKSRRISTEEVEARVREIERRASMEGEDTSEAAAQIREIAKRKISKQLEETLVAFSDWADRFDKKSEIDSITAQINALQEQMDWQALLPLFEKLVAADPSNRAYAEKLRLLKNDLKIKSQEHGNAREFVDDDLRAISNRDLPDRWREIERVAQTLLVEKDHLTLLKLRRSLNTWARELGLEVKGLVDQVQAAGKDEDLVLELQDKLKRIDTLNQSLLKLHKQVQEFLEKLNI